MTPTSCCAAQFKIWTVLVSSYFSANLASESGKVGYTEVVEDFISFSTL
jgi:hypothetical protein